MRILQAVAARRAKIAQEGATDGLLQVGFFGKPNEVTAAPTAALWQKFKFGKLGETLDDENTEVKRGRRSIRSGGVAALQSLSLAKIPPTVASDFQPIVVLVGDNAGGYRFQVPDWLRTPRESVEGRPPEWIVFKTSAPICHGAFWWALFVFRPCLD